MEENKETLDLGFAKLDLQRQQRCGFPEVVYCAGKTVDQSVRILDILMEKYDNVIGTRADKAVYDALAGRIRLPSMTNWPVWSISIRINRRQWRPSHSVITAGTSDIPICRRSGLDGGNHGQPRRTHLRRRRRWHPPPPGPRR